MTDTLGYRVLYLSKCLAPSNEPGDFIDCSVDFGDLLIFDFRGTKKMIGNSSMRGEVNKALAIWRGRPCRAGPRKSWSKFAWSNSNYEDSGISWVVDVVGMHPKIFSGIILGLDQMCSGIFAI